MVFHLPRHRICLPSRSVVDECQIHTFLRRLREHRGTGMSGHSVRAGDVIALGNDAMTPDLIQVAGLIFSERFLPYFIRIVDFCSPPWDLDVKSLLHARPIPTTAIYRRRPNLSYLGVIGGGDISRMVTFISGFRAILAMHTGYETIYLHEFERDDIYITLE
ncbi:hypothetical protein BDR06DRAFT_1025596 [Suillus hirtellus]|nr:hypothetical protein BDR06DRAFT_1025596 [Suillus hirtellus]